MIEIQITKEHLILAKHRANDLGILKNSIEKGQGNITGFLGEIIVAEYYGWEIKNSDSINYDYDLIYKNHKIDVKTKNRKVIPEENYFATVSDYNTKQICDYYFFVSIRNFEYAYLMGIIKKENFYKKAYFNNKGDYDKSSPSHFPFYFKAPCYNLEYSKLFNADKIKINVSQNI